MASSFGQDRFGVKLNAFHRVLTVPQSHNLSLWRPGTDLKTSGYRIFIDDERVIAHGLKRIGQILKEDMARLDRFNIPAGSREKVFSGNILKLLKIA